MSDDVEDLRRLKNRLKGYPKGDPYAVFAPSFQVFGVGDTANIVDAYKLKDIFNAGRDFHVRQLAQLPASVWQKIQPWRAGAGDVFLRESAIDAAEGQYLSEPQAVPKRDAVEDPSFQVIGGIEPHIFVQDELHRFHQTEGVGGEEYRLVGGRDVQLGEWCRIPDDARLKGGVDMAEGG